MHHEVRGLSSEILSGTGERKLPQNAYANELHVVTGLFDWLLLVDITSE